MKRVLKFTIETQTESNEIISTCHLNEKTIALEISDVAKKMLSLNRKLFDKINMSTKLLSGVVYRKQITSTSINKNNLGVKLNNSYEGKDVKIMSIDFSQLEVGKMQSIKTKNGKLITFDPSSLKNSSGIAPLDPQNLTFDDVANSTMICEIEEIQLFQNMGVRTFIIKDFMRDVNKLYQVAHRIEITADTKFKDHVEYVIKEMEKSLTFLTSYYNSVNNPANFDEQQSIFKKHFIESIFNQLGIGENINKINLSDKRIKNSDFGKAALNYYNGLMLIRSSTKSSTYGSVVKSLLPTKKTSTEIILKLVNDYRTLLSTIRREYNIFNKDSKSDYNQSKISTKLNQLKRFIATTTEKYEIEQETLGYNIFSENQTGMNRFTIASYRRRVSDERDKYYPSINLTDDGNSLTNEDKSKFSSNKNNNSYLTTANLVMGNKKISCSRGMNNISPNLVQQFRLAKSARANQKNKTNFPDSLSTARLTRDAMSSYNVTVAEPQTPILERSIDSEIDPLQDAKNYVGERSFFVTDRPDLIFINYNKLREDEDEQILVIVSDVVPQSSLSQNDNVQSAQELQISNNNSRTRQLINERMIDFDEIPPQIKYMMTSRFQNNPDIDPLKNRQSRAIIDETQKNVFLIRALVGFNKDSDGFINLNSPIFENIQDDNLTGKPMLAKAYNYEIPELGIVKDKFMPTIYNNLVYIQG